jgi:hypothetical protein
MPRRTVNMMIYLIQHDAQICALARALGHRLSKDDVMRIWGWKSLTPRRWWAAGVAPSLYN